jgi:hypothetical protein
MCIDMLITHLKSIPSVTWGQKLKINMLIATILFCDDFFPFCKKNIEKNILSQIQILKKIFKK